jgi:hypothetical protein
MRHWISHARCTLSRGSCCIRAASRGDRLARRYFALTPAYDARYLPRMLRPEPVRPEPPIRCRARPTVALVTTIALLVAGVARASRLADPTGRNSPPTDAALVRLPGHMLPALASAIAVPPAPTDARAPVTLTLVLRRDDEPGFGRYLRDVYDASSPSFRHFLSPRDISDRFGPSRTTYDAVVGYAERHDLELVEGAANRLTLTVRGSRAAVERAFDLRLQRYRSGSRTFWANDRDPALPAELASSVQAIVGLSSLATPTSEQLFGWSAAYSIIAGIEFGVLFGWLFGDQFGPPIQQGISSGQSAVGGLVGAITRAWNKAAKSMYTDVITEFNKPDPPGCRNWIGVDGTGQTIGLLEFDTFQTSDVADYLALVGFPDTLLSHVSQVHVNGGAMPGPEQIEVLQDIDAALTNAPGANVVVYDAPFPGAGSSFQPVLNRMIDDGVTIISNSWTYCEDQTSEADARSLDAILQTAAASGITVFNAAGDSGSTCLNGSPNTVGVPGDSPNATAVGGTSLTPGPGNTYGTEAWWNGLGAHPTTGQGGFGTSRFFARPSYQDGLIESAQRSIPDVSIQADPAHGVYLCQASGGGCPTGLLNGGTSGGTPTWAAFAALLNQAQGKNLGFLNPLFYPLASTAGFHDAASMGSDVAHVGLGSPNLPLLHLLLCSETVGPPDAGTSRVIVVAPSGTVLGDARGIPADGTQGGVIVQLFDAAGNPVGGKTVTLAGNPGSHASIMPASGMTSAVNGTFVFTVSDTTIESVTLTATNTSGGQMLPETATIPFVAPRASAGGIDAIPSIVAADGSSAATITVTLRDVHGNGTPGKVVAVSQGSGRSMITGPVPLTTDANGQVAFTATDTFTETVTYDAVDVTDGDLPVPATAQVDFTNGSASACPVGQSVPIAGWAVTSAVTGFALSNNCVGASGTAWDPSGNLWVMNYPTGKLYKVPPAGGAANDATLVGQVPNATPPTGMPSCPHGLTFSKDGQHLYLARQFCGAGGDVVEISTADASIVRSLTSADAIHCATGIATDPLSGDLFVTSPCQAGNDVFRIANPESGSPQLSVYASPGRAIGLNFTPDGTMWTEAYPNGTGSHLLVKISGTNSAHPGTVTQLSTDAPPFAGGVLPVVNPMDPGNPPFLLVSNGATGGASGSISKVDLTQTPPVVSQIATGASGMIFLNGGPDGCAYVSNGDRIDRITAADGSCTFAPSTGAPTLTLTPTTVSPHPAQGTAQTFTARFLGTAVPAGTPVSFVVIGTNPQTKMVRTNAAGEATFTYTALFPGFDTIVAGAPLGASNLTSNAAHVTWDAGKHSTFLSLNPSPRTATPGQAVGVVAWLTDISVVPDAFVVGQRVDFTLGNAMCSGVTDASGIASCKLTPSASGMGTLAASFAGTDALAAASASVGFNAVGRPCEPLNCDDADPCTADTCADGACENVAPSGFDGATCYVDAALTALHAAAATDVAKRTKAQITSKLSKIKALIQTARGGGKKGKRARKKADHLLAALERRLGKLPTKKLAHALASELVRFVDDAKSALDTA